MELNLWDLKTFALLHDPPHKPLIHGDDPEAIGRDLARRICQRDLSDEEWAAIKASAAIAFGADSTSFLADLSVDPRHDLTLIHPLDGETLAQEKDGRLEFAETPVSAPDIEDARSLVEGPSFVEAFAKVEDPRLRYLLLFRFATDVLRASTDKGGGGLQPLWDVLPADLKMPTHPISVHATFVSAIAPILAQGRTPSLLKFAIGPVQPFIEAARTLSDLWAGSSILAWATFKAMEPIIEEFGPDAILFPHLRWQPLFDDWLLQLIQDRASLPEALRDLLEKGAQRSRPRIPSLPNIFLALLPRDLASEFANRCKEALQNAIVEKVSQILAESGLEGDDDVLVERAKVQWLEAIDIFWAVAPWPIGKKVSEVLKEAWPKWLAKEKKELLARLEKLQGYKPNGGFLYPLVFEQASLLLNSCKLERLFGKGKVEEGGLKCTMCGEREVLLGRDFYEQRSIWRDLAGRLPYLREGDALCGVCFVKRLWDRKKGFRHPSTTEVATSRFKMEVFREAKEDKAVYNALKDLHNFVKDLEGIDDTKVATPSCCLRAAGDDEVLKDLASIDGQVFLSIGLREKAWDQAILKGLKERQKALLKALSKDGTVPLYPSPYLAVVVFDGDEVGKWLSGEKGPKVIEMVHPKGRAALKGPLGDIRRPVTPAIHASQSQICASFAAFVAPWTVEREDLPGHLVYAGGDDCLFLAPPLDALKLVWRLRLRFSGYPWPIPGETDPKVPQEARPWFRTDEGPIVLTFGKEATASAGMCVFHAKEPLGLALEEARKAEREAKKAGRNALGVKVLRRSGQQSEAIVPFGEVFLKVLELSQWFRSHKVSRSVHMVLAREFEALVPEGFKEAEEVRPLAEALVRRAIDHRLVEGEDEREGLRELVLGLGSSLFAYLTKNKKKGLRGSDFLWPWAEIVGIAEFVARPFDRKEEE